MATHDHRVGGPAAAPVPGAGRPGHTTAERPAAASGPGTAAYAAAGQARAGAPAEVDAGAGLAAPARGTNRPAGVRRHPAARAAVGPAPYIAVERADGPARFRPPLTDAEIEAIAVEATAPGPVLAGLVWLGRRLLAMVCVVMAVTCLLEGGASWAGSGFGREPVAMFVGFGGFGFAALWLAGMHPTD